MGRIMSFGQDGRMVADFDKSEHDFLRKYGRTPDEVMAENTKLRELVRDIYESAYYEYPSYFESKFAGRMRELGILEEA